jgi:hypothetical protein
VLGHFSRLGFFADWLQFSASVVQSTAVCVKQTNFWKKKFASFAFAVRVSVVLIIPKVASKLRPRSALTRTSIGDANPQGIRFFPRR